MSDLREVTAAVIALNTADTCDYDTATGGARWYEADALVQAAICYRNSIRDRTAVGRTRIRGVGEMVRTPGGNIHIEAARPIPDPGFYDWDRAW